MNKTDATVCLDQAAALVERQGLSPFAVLAMVGAVVHALLMIALQVEYLADTISLRRP